MSKNLTCPEYFYLLKPFFCNINLVTRKGYTDHIEYYFENKCWGESTHFFSHENCPFWSIPVRLVYVLKKGLKRGGQSLGACPLKDDFFYALLRASKNSLGIASAQVGGSESLVIPETQR